MGNYIEILCAAIKTEDSELFIQCLNSAEVNETSKFFWYNSAINTVLDNIDADSAEIVLQFLVDCIIRKSTKFEVLYTWAKQLLRHEKFGQKLLAHSATALLENYCFTLVSAKKDLNDTTNLATRVHTNLVNNFTHSLFKSATAKLFPISKDSKPLFEANIINN